jgi:hypothetical protein
MIDKGLRLHAELIVAPGEEASGDEGSSDSSDDEDFEERKRLMPY